MKKVIRWLADVSGVSTDVRYETMKDIGGRIYQDHYWFNGGVPGAWLVSNALQMYGSRLKNLIIPDVDRIRTEVYKSGDFHKENL
jgi:hypothetical protein